MAFYKEIRNLRKEAGKTQTEIAQLLDTTAQYYGKYEKGDRELPFSRVIMLADYYDVSLDYIAERSSCGGGLDSDEKNLVFAWRKLSERDRGKLELYVSQLLGEKT